jgi:hypothetical protein
MQMDRPLAVGAVGGHGPIHYEVSQYRPGEIVRFVFTAPAGFEGFHEFAVEPSGEATCLLRHEISMRLHGLARVSWPLVYRPLHDALLEDALDCAERACGSDRVGPPTWSPYVRMLRALARPRSRSVHTK